MPEEVKINMMSKLLENKSHKNSSKNLTKRRRRKLLRKKTLKIRNMIDEKNRKLKRKRKKFTSHIVNNQSIHKM